MTHQNASAELARIGRTAARVRLAVVSTALALGLAAISLAVVLTSLLPEHTVHEPGSWVPMGLSLLTVAMCLVLTYAARAYLARHQVPILVPEVERSVGLRRGELAGALELSSDTPMESHSLAEFGRQLVADKLSAYEDWELFPETLRRVGRRISWAGVLVLVALGGLAIAAMRTPARTLAAATALGQPWSTAFPPPPPRIHIAPGDTAVLRGERLEVRIVASMRDSVILVWQPVGEPIATVRLAVESDGAAASMTAPIEAPTQFWVEARDGSRSDAHEVIPLDPLLVTELSIEFRYPTYLQRPTESVGSLVGNIEVPAGTTIRIEGRTNEPLSRARLVEEGSAAIVEFDVAVRRFSAEWRPETAGDWRWILEPASTLPGIRAPEAFGLVVVADLIPSVEVVYPGRDTVASVDLRLPMVVDARDDIGLAGVDLETWRISAAGVKSAPVTVPLWEALIAQRYNLRIVLRPVLRLDVLDLVPGDTLFYVARARDGHPGHRYSLSDTFRVFIPSLAELRRSAAESAADLARSSQELRDDAADLARAARDAQRRSERGKAEQSSGGVPDASEFGATEESRRVLERGQELDQRIADMERRMDELREGAEESGLADARMREKFEQLEELFRQIEETGLGEQLRQLEQALRNLDSRQTQQELGDLSSKLREMEARLEQTLALMERVATEQTMKDATESAQQLADRQSELAETFEQDDSWADRQADVAADADRLAERLEALRDELTAQGLDAAADSIARGSEQMSSASAEMRAAQQAAKSDGRSGSNGGQSSASQAAEQMQESAQSVESAGEMLNEDWKQEALEAVGRATQEALDLAQEQAVLSADLLQDPQSAPGFAGRQASLVQGLDRLLESLSEAGRKTALIDRSVGSTATEARDRMQELGEALGGRDGPPRGAGAESQALVETLNDLAGRLMASRRAVESAGSATGMEEALDQLAQMSQSQAGLNRESGGLMLMQQNGQPMDMALQRLAERQAEIARQLKQLAEQPAAGELPARPELLAGQADEIAHDLASGRLDQNTLRRQEQLFRRLLDAGRSLERDEDPERRESKAADLSRPGSVPEPGADVETGPRFPYPGEEELRAASRSDRRLILDYFDRLNAADGGSP